MVEQTATDSPPPGRVAAARGDAADWVAPWYALPIFVALLLIPGNFSVAGASLSPYRVVMLATFPLLIWRWLAGAAGRPNVVDVLFLLSSLWLVAALLVNHALGMLPRAVILFVEGFGGYLAGRLLVRGAADYKALFRYLTIALVALLPFVLVELLTGKNIVRDAFSSVFNVPPRQSNLARRLGMTRVQGVFDHPIIFGQICAIGVANVFYIWRDRFLTALRLTAFFVFMVFASISSGPMLAVLAQGLMILWDRFLWFLRWRWQLGAIVVAVLLGVVWVASEIDLLGLVIENLMFNPQTADGRLVILDYGTAEVLRNPVFGIGLNDWVRPWWKHPTLDNFWLGQAMRFGIPSLVFLLAGLAISCVWILTQVNLTAEEARYRTGYMIALAGLVVVLGTVNIWGAASVFISMYFGAGAWFYAAAGRVEHVPAAVRARRRAQALALEGEPAAAAAVAAPGGARRVRLRDLPAIREERRTRRAAELARRRGGGRDRRVGGDGSD